MAFPATGTPANYTIGGLQFMFWEGITGTPVTHAITAAVILDKEFTVAGDQTATILAGQKIRVTGSTGNDGLYTVVSATLAGPDTEIVVEEVVADATADGDISLDYGVYQQFGNIVTGSFTSDITFLDHFSAKTGTRTKDRSLVQEIAVTVNLTVDEPTPELMNLFMLGGAITGAGPKVFAPYMKTERTGAGKLFAVSDTGNEFYWDIPRCTVKPDGEFAYNDQDWSQYSFVVEILSDTRFPANPYGRIYHLGTDQDLTPAFT